MSYFLISFFLFTCFNGTQAGNSPAACTINASSQDCLCYGSCDGSGVAFGSGGTSPYSYSWFPAPAGGQGTENATGLCAGTYTVQLSDATGCSASTTITVAQPTQITYTNVVTQASCSSCCDGKDTIYVSGGSVPGYTYTWSPGPLGSGNSQFNLCAGGTYTCCIQDAHHCRLCAPISISYPTGIIRSTKCLPVRTYPNPFHTSIQIENLPLLEPVDFCIYNSRQQVLIKGELSQGNNDSVFSFN